jgi:HNH endonuclease
MSLDPEYITECLTYDPETGLLYWRERARDHFQTTASWLKTNAREAGKIAGAEHHCRGLRHSVRIYITRNGKEYVINAARAAFILMGVEIPDGMIPDHKDNNALNNAWSNLRLATVSQNAQNKASNRNRKNKLPKGVYKNGRKYRASIFVKGKAEYLGSFDEPEDAHAAYVAAAKESFGEFARFN